jgi:type IV pilus assembly protein PilW
MSVRRFTPRQQGFSLVELMVGIVVAMAAVVVVMQVFKLSEGQRRATTGGDDAQTTGAIVLTQLQREIRQAGQGFTDPNMLGCSLDLGNGRSVNNLGTLIINAPEIPDGDDGSDTLLIGYGSATGAPEGTLIVKTNGTTYQVATAADFHLADRVAATPQTRIDPCNLSLAKVTVSPDGTPNVTVDTVVAGVGNGGLVNLGSTPGFVAYAVRGGRLTRCDYFTQDCTSANAANWTEMAEGIVSLRAEYATATGSFDQTTPPTCAAWYGVIGARLALVARNSQYSPDDVTTAAPTWAGSASTPISLGGDWTHYRYKTFETTVPIRNLAGARSANTDSTGLFTPPC